MSKKKRNTKAKLDITKSVEFELVKEEEWGITLVARKYTAEGGIDTESAILSIDPKGYIILHSDVDPDLGLELDEDNKIVIR